MLSIKAFKEFLSFRDSCKLGQTLKRNIQGHKFVCKVFINL